MRKALVVLLSFLVMLGFGACTYNAYMTKERPMQFSHIGYRNSTINGKTYSVQVRSKVMGRPISGYDYKVKDGTLYLTVLYRPSGENLMEIYKDEGDFKKYVKINITADEEIKKVYYRFNGKGNDSAISYEIYLNSSELEYKNLSLDANGVFKGTFRCDLDGAKLLKYTDKIEGNNLYLTFTGTTGKNVMAGLNEEGYASIEINTQRNIQNVYLRNGNELVLLASK